MLSPVFPGGQARIFFKDPRKMGGRGKSKIFPDGRGAAVEWLFRTMCGIRVAGENRFTVCPHPGGHFTFAQASYDSVYGTIASSWERKDGKTRYVITVPLNCTARIVIGEEHMDVPAGTYELVR